MRRGGRERVLYKLHGWYSVSVHKSGAAAEGGQGGLEPPHFSQWGG